MTPRPAGNAVLNRLPDYSNVPMVNSGVQQGGSVADDGFNWARALSPEERTRRLFADFQRTGRVSNNLWSLGIDRNLFDQLMAQNEAQTTASNRATQAALPRPNLPPRPPVNPVPNSPLSTVPSPISTQGGSPFQGNRARDMTPWKPRLPSYLRR